MRQRSITLAAFAALLTLSCSDSTGPTIALTDEEVGQLFVVISSLSGGVDGGGLLPPPMRPAGAPNGTTSTVTLTSDCEGGGTVSLSGTATENTTSASFDITESFATCTSDPFTIAGSLRYTGNITAPNDSTFTLNATMKGGIDVTHTDGRSGRCPINFTMTLSINGQEINVNSSGTICGRNASAVASVTG
jgi:hypothetical protein